MKNGKTSETTDRRKGFRAGRMRWIVARSLVAFSLFACVGNGAAATYRIDKDVYTSDDFGTVSIPAEFQGSMSTVAATRYLHNPLFQFKVPQTGVYDLQLSTTGVGIRIDATAFLWKDKSSIACATIYSGETCCVSLTKGMEYTVSVNLDEWDVSAVAECNFVLSVAKSNSSDYTVKFCRYAPQTGGNNGGEDFATQTHVKGQFKNLLRVYTDLGWNFDGYRFVRWDYQPSSVILATYQDGELVKDIGNAAGTVELHARWEFDPSLMQTYLVAFYKNDGGNEAEVQRHKIGSFQSLTAVDSFGWSRKGWSFLGWSVSPGAAEATYRDAESVCNLGSAGCIVKLYAVWRAKPPETYSVAYKPGSLCTGPQDIVMPTTKTEGVPVQLKGLSFTRAGYTQTGWSMTDGGSKAYGLGASYTADAPAVLYPYWTANSYGITYVLNGGKHGATHPTSAMYDTIFSVSAPSRSGYVFAGWMVTGGFDFSTARWGTSSEPATAIGSTATKCINGSDAVSFKNLTSAAGGNVTLTACWGELPSYGAGKVSQFDLPAELGGGFARVVGVDNLAAGTFAKVLYKGNTWDMNGKPPAVDHYYWCFTGSANLIDVEKDSTFENQDDFWCYDLTDLNLAYFGGWIPKSKYATVDAVANAFRKAKNAETFKWLDGKLSSFGLADRVSVSDYIVDFEGIPYEAEFHGFLEEQFNGGKRLVHLGVSGHDVTCCGYSTGTDDRLNGLFIIDSDNDMFNGGGAEKAPNRIMFCPLRGNIAAVDFDWLKDGELLIANIFAEDWAPIDYAFALKHVTEPKEPKVVFDGVGVPVSPSEKAIIPGAPFGELPAPERIGYSFAGWQNDAYGSVTADTVVRYDEVVVLHAVWEAHHYTVCFHSNEGGDETYEQHLTYDVAQKLTPNAFVNGVLYFAGWATLPDGPSVYSDRRSVVNLTAEDGAVLDLYAVWSEDPPISWTEAQLFYGTYADTKGKTGAVTLTTAKGTEKDGVVSATLTAKVKIGGKTYSYKGGKIADGEVTKLPTSSTKGAPKFSELELGGLGVSGTVGGYVLDGERIEKPVLAIGESRNAMVGVRYERTVAVENPFGGVKYSASGLPAGLKINASTGVISGVPTKAKIYSKVKITATSKVSSSYKTSQTLTIAIAALPAWARGTFNGEVSVDGVPGSATISVGSTGKVSAKFSAGGTNWTSTATGYSTESDAANGHFEFAGTVKAKISKKLTLSAPLKFSFAGLPASGPAATCLDGSWTDESETAPSATFTAFRNAWKDSGASAYLNGWMGVYTWCDAVGGKVKLTLGASGTVKIAGTLSSGRKISLSAPLLYDCEDVGGARKLLLHAGAVTAKVKGRKVAYPEFHALLYLVDKYLPPDIGGVVAYRDPGVKASVDDASTGNGILSYSTSYGQAASNKTVKVTAKAKSGSVFAYWLKDGVIVGYETSYSVKMAGEDVRGLVAVFRLKSDYLEDPNPYFDASDDSVFDNLSVGVAFKTQVKVADSCYPVKFTATGLPPGLKINAKSGVISGVPTAMGDKVVNVTATCTAATSRKGTVAQEMRIAALPSWARGSFGAGCEFFSGSMAGKRGSATLKIEKTGKISGKLKIDSKSYSISWPGYDAFDDSAYWVSGKMKVAGTQYETSVAVTPTDAGGTYLSWDFFLDGDLAGYSDMQR